MRELPIVARPAASDGPPAASDGAAPRRGRAKVRHPLVLRRLTVARVVDLGGSMRRVTLAGPELAGFVSDGPTDHLALFLPDPATGRLVLPEATPEGLRDPDDGAGQVIRRDYTPRAFRPDALELDIDLVLHGDEGPAARWAASVVPGAPSAVAGPRGSKLMPEGAGSYLLVADETALPAVARWLERIPARTPVRVLAEIQHPDDTRYLGDPRIGVDVRWLLRGSAAPGTTALLEAAVRALGPLDPRTFAWCAGEAGSLVGVRRYLRGELGLGADRAEVSGYWRRGVGGYDHHAPVDPSDPA